MRSRRGRSGRTLAGLIATANAWGQLMLLCSLVALLGGLWLTVLGWNINELRKGVLAATGHYGRAGIVTVLETKGHGRGEYCSGRFRYSDATTVAVEVRQRGNCIPGVEKPARLVRANKIGPSITDGRDVAWTRGSTGWVPHVLLSLLFGTPVLVFAGAIARSRRWRSLGGIEGVTPT